MSDEQRSVKIIEWLNQHPTVAKWAKWAKGGGTVLGGALVMKAFGIWEEVNLSMIVEWISKLKSLIWNAPNGVAITVCGASVLCVAMVCGTVCRIKKMENDSRNVQKRQEAVARFAEKDGKISQIKMKDETGETSLEIDRNEERTDHDHIIQFPGNSEVQ